mmetsp:Transcript_14348/g.21480  ORF Transcript_14348/g.21480 Transcript_14348/m.21480 type:complete len:82 (+) Transcript_14348:102-347(+)|eukprot:7772919-Ditylum_brightwellii.AAC.1
MPPSSSTSRLSSIPKGPAVVLGLTTTVALYAVFYSHFSQVRDKAVMREGVERDKARMRYKRKMEKKQQKLLEEGEGGSVGR